MDSGRINTNGNGELMATYITIKGMAVQILDADPSNPVEGQVWYTGGALKGYNGTSNVTFTTS